jgi:hypothetical protein
MNWVFIFIALGVIILHFATRLLVSGGEKLERRLPKRLGIKGYHLIKVGLIGAMMGGIGFIISLFWVDRA